MKRTLTALAVFSALVSVASAQTRIGNVILTPAPRAATPAPTPAQVPHRATTVKASPARAVPATPAVPATRAVPASSAPSMTVPSGMYEVRGYITGPSAVSLPAGSTVTLTLNNVTRPAQLLTVNFKTRSLPSNYQMYFNSGRLNSTDRYVVRATVADPSGKVLYRSTDVTLGRNVHTLNLPVR